MEIKENYSFQVDSDLVKEALQNNDNYLIEYSSEVNKKYCIIYFSSNDLYYPNTDMAFQEQLLKKNRFEWYKTRIQSGYKHIFLRDIQKQWYLGGINSRLNTPQKLLSFLKEETSGFQIMMLGSSAGGFASVIYGQLLKAERIYTFNGQFEILSLLDSTDEKINPLLFRNRNNPELKKWYDTRNFISDPSTIYYFQSIKSNWDISQYLIVKDIPINRISFNTSNHGVPFLSANLPHVINYSALKLTQMTKKMNHPLIFSIRTIGVISTILALSVIIKFGFKKLYINTVLKLKPNSASIKR
jgi:hypothetical protein